MLLSLPALPPEWSETLILINGGDNEGVGLCWARLWPQHFNSQHLRGKQTPPPGQSVVQSAWSYLLFVVNFCLLEVGEDDVGLIDCAVTPVQSRTGGTVRTASLSVT